MKVSIRDISIVNNKPIIFVDVIKKWRIHRRKKERPYLDGPLSSPLSGFRPYRRYGWGKWGWEFLEGKNIPLKEVTIKKGFQGKKIHWNPIPIVRSKNYGGGEYIPRNKVVDSTYNVSTMYSFDDEFILAINKKYHLILKKKSSYGGNGSGSWYRYGSI